MCIWGDSTHVTESYTSEKEQTNATLNKHGNPLRHIRRKKGRHKGCNQNCRQKLISSYKAQNHG